MTFRSQTNAVFVLPNDGTIARSEMDRNHYAIRRRCVLPAWWVCGCLVDNLSSELALAKALSSDSQVLIGAGVSPKFFSLLCTLWNEMMKLVGAGRGGETSVEIPLERHLKGTSLEISEQLGFLETFWASPLRLANPFSGTVSARGVRGRRLGRSKAAVNSVRHCRIAQDGALTLRIDFATTLEDFCMGRFSSDGEISQEVVGAGEVVSVNPDVILAFGGGRSLKKLCSYLLVEFLKRGTAVEGVGGDAWFGGLLGSSSLWGFHKDLLGRTKALYDHGVFGWANAAPQTRVSELRKRLCTRANAGSGVVHLFRVSQQTFCATQVEWEFVRRLNGEADISERPALSLVASVSKKSEPEPLIAQATVEEIRELRTEMRTVQPEVVVESEEESVPPSPPTQCDSELDFIVRVAEYYASLSDDMRRLFEIERSQMSPNEFKVFISAIMRSKAKPRRR